MNTSIRPEENQLSNLTFVPHDEVWLKVEDYPNYEVSNLGNVRSNRGGKAIWGTTIVEQRHTRAVVGYEYKVLKANLMGNKLQKQYLGLDLAGPSGSKRKSVHRLVALAFVPNPNPDMYTEVNHKDGNTLNNRADNLEWVTRLENMRHAHDMGLVPYAKGSIPGEERFTIHTAQAIKQDLVDGLSQNEVIEKYGVNQPLVSSIKTGRTWNHVKVEGEEVLHSRTKRGASGSQHGHAKLTEASVREMLQALIDGTMTKKQAAAHYGINPATLSDIVGRRTWTHVYVEGQEALIGKQDVKRGSDNPTAKLDEAKVRMVLEMLRDGYKGKDIAELLKVSLTNISDIKNGRIWKHVQLGGNNVI